MKIGVVFPRTDSGNDAAIIRDFAWAVRVCSKPDAQRTSSRELPLVPSAENRQLCIKPTHDDSRLVDTHRACKVAK
jgi:hypothetical protein